MTKKEWLCKEILKWQAEGVVQEDVALALLARYKNKENSFSCGAVISGAFGALLIGLGIISLFAANWDELNRPARAAVSIAPLVVCALVSGIASHKNVKSMAFWEPIGILWCISTAAASCLVAQTYQVGGTVPGLILLVSLLSLPVVWITKSVAAMSFWPLYVIAWTLAVEETDGRTPILLYEAIAFLLLSLPAYIAFVRRKVSPAALVSGQIVTGFVYSVGTASIVLTSLRVTHLSSGIYVFWLCSALLLLAGIIFRLPCWPFIATLVASFAAIFSISTDGPFVVALLLGVSTSVYGISKVKLSYLNVGAALLLFLVIAKFFESEVSFTVKGLVLICAGVFLTCLNVFMLRYKKRKDNK
jgi:uncharacterized membrane protein